VPGCFWDLYRKLPLIEQRGKVATSDNSDLEFFWNNPADVIDECRDAIPCIAKSDHPFVPFGMNI